jgi:hypothetical protein
MEKKYQNVYKQEEQMIIKTRVSKETMLLWKASELKEAADFQRQRLTEIYENCRRMITTVKKWMRSTEI